MIKFNGEMKVNDDEILEDRNIRRRIVSSGIVFINKNGTCK